jgi:hypothetical protein
VVALVLALGLQAGEVGAGSGFRIALAPAEIAVDDLGQVLLLLSLVAVFQQHRAQHPDAERGERLAVFAGGQLLVQHAGLGRGEAGAAIFGRPGGGGVALGRCGPHPDRLGVIGAGEGAAAPDGFRVGLGLGVAKLRGIVGFKPAAHFTPECVEVAAAEVGHGILPSGIGFSGATLASGAPRARKTNACLTYEQAVVADAIRL